MESGVKLESNHSSILQPSHYLIRISGRAAPIWLYVSGCCVTYQVFRCSSAVFFHSHSRSLRKPVEVFGSPKLERMFLQHKASVLPLLSKKNCGHAANRNHMWNLWMQCVSYRAESVAGEVSVVATNLPSPWQHHTCCQLFYDHCCMVMQLKHRRELCAVSCCRIRARGKKARLWLVIFWCLC